MFLKTWSVQREALPYAGQMLGRSFRLFQMARLLVIGTAQMVSVAVGWQVYDRTRDPLSLGMVGLAQFLPSMLLALFGGQLADRVDRRRILLVCAVVYGLGAGVLAATEHLAAVYAVLVLFGGLRAFSGPAGQALLPNLVPEKELARAIAASSSAVQLGSIAGPALGGVLYAWGGGRFVFVLAALCFVGTFALYAGVRPLRVQHAAKGQVGLQHLLTGLRFVFRTPMLLGVISLDMFAVLLGGATALLPIFSRDVLHAGPTGLGLLRAAPGIGAAIVGALLAMIPIRRHAGPFLFASFIVFGAATVVFGLSRDLALSLAALLVVGASDMVNVVIRMTVVQLWTPEEMRGRVSAVNLVFIGASNEFGEFESGLTAALFGVKPAVVLGGLGSCLVALLYVALFPTLRRADRLELPNKP